MAHFFHTLFSTQHKLTLHCAQLYALFYDPKTQSALNLQSKMFLFVAAKLKYLVKLEIIY